MAENENNTEENSDALIDLGFGDSVKVSDALALLTLLPTRGFILAVFTLIVLLGIPPVLDTLPEEGWWRAGSLIGISLSVAVVGAILWRTSEDYKRSNRLLRELNRKEKELNKTIKNLKKNRQSLDDIIQQSKKIEKLLKSSKTSLSKMGIESSPSLNEINQALKILDLNKNKAEALLDKIDSFRSIPSDFFVRNVVSERSKKKDQEFDEDLWNETKKSS